MKRLIYTLAICGAAYFASAQTVYITATGKKFYHTKSCPEVKTDAKEIELKEAKKNGYNACVSCGADKLTVKEEKAGDKKRAAKKE